MGKIILEKYKTNDKANNTPELKARKDDHREASKMSVKQNSLTNFETTISGGLEEQTQPSKHRNQNKALRNQKLQHLPL